MSEARVAVVTGAARGIGAAVVRRLAGDGWCVVAADRCADDPAVGYPLGTREQLAELAAEYPDRVIDAVADVRDPEALREVVSLAEERFGGLDAAVGAAALMAGGKPFWEAEESEWEVLFSTGVTGVANLARTAIPALLRRPSPRSGRFVALASAAAHRGLWRLTSYNAAKHAVVGLVRGLAHDLRGTGVCASAVSPGSTRTDMLSATADLYELSDVEQFAEHQLTDGVLDPDEIAATVAFLCSRDSSAITGTVVHADGGFTA